MKDNLRIVLSVFATPAQSADKAREVNVGGYVPIATRQESGGAASCPHSR
jgi:hypothetical protein